MRYPGTAFFSVPRERHKPRYLHSLEVPPPEVALGAIDGDIGHVEPDPAMDGLAATVELGAGEDVVGRRSKRVRQVEDVTLSRGGVAAFNDKP